MKIQFKTGGIFVDHLPPGTSGSSAEIEEAEVISERDTKVLAENDHLAVMPPLKGG